MLQFQEIDMIQQLVNVWYQIEFACDHSFIVVVFMTVDPNLAADIQRLEQEIKQLEEELQQEDLQQSKEAVERSTSVTHPDSSISNAIRHHNPTSASRKRSLYSDTLEDGAKRHKINTVEYRRRSPSRDSRVEHRNTTHEPPYHRRSPPPGRVHYQWNHPHINVSRHNSYPDRPRPARGRSPPPPTRPSYAPWHDVPLSDQKAQSSRSGDEIPIPDFATVVFVTETHTHWSVAVEAP